MISKMKIKYKSVFYLFAMLIIIPLNIYAGVTGKLAGTVVDANTGEPLLGVNVIIDNTLLGAATDEDGYYSIIGIPPGTYSVRAIYMGYGEVAKTGVTISIDRTTNLTFKLTETSLELDEITVVAEMPVISLDISASKRDIKSEELKEIAISNFNNVLNLQPGTTYRVVTSDAKEEISSELSIRGGTGVGVMLDGMNVTESIISGSMTNINLSALQESEILTGGFNAEYGNIRSGMINLVTKEGDPKYTFGIDVKMSNVGRKHFGKSIYDTLSAPEWRMYGTEEALIGDPDDPEDSYWEKFAAADTVYGFTPEQAQKVWKYQHRPRKYGHKPDYIVDGSFGGPLLGPFLKNSLTFFTSLRFEYNMFSVPLSRDHFEDTNWFWKITARPTNSIKINFQGNYQKNISTTTYNTSHVSVATPEQAVFSMQYPLTKYYDAMRSLADRFRNQYGITLSHVLSSDTYYDFKISYNLRRSYVNHMKERSSATAFSIGGYDFDSGPQGGWVYATTVTDFGGREADLGIDTTGYAFLFGGHGKERDFSSEQKIASRLDLVSQINKHNLIKTGFEINHTDMHYESGLVQYSPPMVKMNTFNRKPLQVAAYVQDKLEFKGMIANIGLRLDYTKRSGNYYTDMYSSFYEVDSVSFAPTSSIDPYIYVSPRIGVSHPITEKSKLFFNYGHFYDEPKVEYLYTQRERSNGDLDRIPNSNLKPQKTIAYELGFEQQFGESYLLHCSGFYRNITNQVKWIEYYSENGTYVNTYNNDNYADVRGVEILFEKKIGDFIIGSLSYDYLVRSSGNVGIAAYYESSEKEEAESSHEQYTYSDYNFAGLVTFRTPAEFGPRVFGMKMFEKWSLNFIHEYQSGKTITYNPEGLPGVVNNLRWRPHINTDMRLSKTFRFAGVTTQAYFEVLNLFNRKELTPYLRSYLLPNLKLYYAYLESLEDGDRPGDYKKDHIQLPDERYFPTQLLFLNPRRFFFGIRINY